MKHRTRTISIISILLILAASVMLGLYLFQRTHADLREIPADVSLRAEELHEAFSTDEALANERFINKVVEVEGFLLEKEIPADTVAVLLIGAEGAPFGVSCSMVPSAVPGVRELTTGQQVRVKGICTGMLMDVNLVRGVLVP